jgi:hypothetical protein
MIEHVKFVPIQTLIGRTTYVGYIVSYIREIYEVCMWVARHLDNLMPRSEIGNS